MTTSFAILARMFLSLVTAGSFAASHCGIDLRLTPSDDVLIGIDTPVYFLKANASSESGYIFSKQDHVMMELKKILPVYPESANGKINIDDKCSEPQSEWYKKDVLGPLKCKAPDTIYPKIVIVVDNPMFKAYGNMTELIKFLMAYWNGVDVLYRTLEHPKVRFHIAGIIVAEEPNVLPFLSKNEISDMYEYSATPRALGQFMETKGASWSYIFGNYHMVTVMTAKKLCSMVGETCKLVNDHSTVEWSRDMCTDVNNKGPPARVVVSVDRNWMRIRRTAKIVEETFKPWGLLGEKFNCAYNGSSVTRYARDTVNDWPDWSECYLNSFKKRFNNEKTSCFFRKPSVTSPLPRLQLGRLFPGEAQCAFMNMGDSCTREGTCKNLLCMDTKTNRCKPADVPAADGTVCGPEKICYRRECVLEESVLGTMDTDFSIAMI